jgi:hypothetical protein
VRGQVLGAPLPMHLQLQHDGEEAIHAIHTGNATPEV